MSDERRTELGTWQQLRRDVDALEKVSPLHRSLVRAKQDNLADRLLAHAAELLDVMIERATAEQCSHCRGYGYYVEFVASDEQRRHRCTACGGSGLSDAERDVAVSS